MNVRTSDQSQQTLVRHPRRPSRRHRSGVAMIFTVVSFTLFAALASLAVDYGHVQLVKMEMQRCADAAARGYVDVYETYVNTYGSAASLGYALTDSSYIASQAYNPVDINSGATPTVVITPGTWSTTSNTFTANGTTYNATNVVAAQVTLYRNTAHGNAIPLFWGQVFGKKWCDAHAMCTAALMDAGSANVSVPATASPYLVDQPGSYNSIYGDNASNATPYGVTSVPVVPGTWITMTGTGGTTSIVPGVVPAVGPSGSTSLNLHHGQNYNSVPNPGGPYPENGIADAIMPASAMCGLFMGPVSSHSQTAPSGEVDWTNPAQANQASYTNIVTQQPFLIGDGKNNLLQTQKFLVPPGATRLYLGIWDGTQYSNNTGTLTGTINVVPKAAIVQIQ